MSRYDEDERDEEVQDVDEEPSEDTSVFDAYFDDPYAELDEVYDEDEPEEHPLSTRNSRRRRHYRHDD